MQRRGWHHTVDRHRGTARQRLHRAALREMFQGSVRVFRDDAQRTGGEGPDLLTQPSVVQCGQYGLAGASRSDDEVTPAPVPSSFGIEQLEDFFLKWIWRMSNSSSGAAVRWRCTLTAAAKRCASYRSKWGSSQYVSN